MQIWVLSERKRSVLLVGAEGVDSIIMTCDPGGTRLE